MVVGSRIFREWGEHGSALDVLRFLKSKYTKICPTYTHVPNYINTYVNQ